jgi:hypothetical protein
MKTKLSIDLDDPKLISLLNLEAKMTNQTTNEILIHALESYFHHRLETKSLMKLADSAFEDWENDL